MAALNKVLLYDDISCNFPRLSYFLAVILEKNKMMWHFLNKGMHAKQGSMIIDYFRGWFQAENTFILALDGDVDFKPDAVRLLVDRMRIDPKTGASCGRIHPIGSGQFCFNIFQIICPGIRFKKPNYE